MINFSSLSEATDDNSQNLLFEFNRTKLMENPFAFILSKNFGISELKATLVYNLWHLSLEEQKLVSFFELIIDVLCMASALPVPVINMKYMITTHFPVCI
ncbi:hypothetical protein O6H91_07G002000 [Diphasiastrum complanatum]|uniref:Uncharacterized protein n=1 Tax=Diphasiastrum complanatum TaxID=34168 RepID=A0ACC2D230_DIPCM|nr:hypothetical protein O6H91_07G002000 [Diphasiastrum complanatum]